MPRSAGGHQPPKPSGRRPKSTATPAVIASALRNLQFFEASSWGRSLGSGPATYTAARREARALLLESPFTSAVAYAARHYRYLPVELLVLDQYPVSEWIEGVEEPVFVGHGTDDDANTLEEGQRIFALAPNPVEIWIEPGGIWERAKGFFAGAMQ